MKSSNIPIFILILALTIGCGGGGGGSNPVTKTLASLALTPLNLSLPRGTVQQFTATGTYSDGSTQDLTTSVSWTSSDTSVATISNASGSNGSATSIAAGTTTITAALGGISASTTLTVTTATLVSLAISPTNPSIALGTTQQFTATGTYSDGSTQVLTQSASWTSSVPVGRLYHQYSGFQGERHIAGRRYDDDHRGRRWRLGINHPDGDPAGTPLYCHQPDESDHRSGNEPAVYRNGRLLEQQHAGPDDSGELDVIGHLGRHYQQCGRYEWARHVGGRRHNDDHRGARRRLGDQPP